MFLLLIISFCMGLKNQCAIKMHFLHTLVLLYIVFKILNNDVLNWVLLTLGKLIEIYPTPNTNLPIKI